MSSCVTVRDSIHAPTDTDEKNQSTAQLVRPLPFLFISRVSIVLSFLTNSVSRFFAGKKVPVTQQQAKVVRAPCVLCRRYFHLAQSMCAICLTRAIHRLRYWCISLLAGLFLVAICDAMPAGTQQTVLIQSVYVKLTRRSQYIAFGQIVTT